MVVCTSEDLQEKVQRLLLNRSRDEIFELPFVYGQALHYVPDKDRKALVPAAPGYTYEVLFEKEIRPLYGLNGFENALAFDGDGTTPTKAVCIARHGQKIVGAAGAAGSAVKDLWEAGVDVQEGYRDAGPGSCLVSRLTEELLARGILPFYSASGTNLGGSSAYDNLVKSLWL